MEDVRQLLEVLQRLVDSGNTVLVIEHNLDVIKSAGKKIRFLPRLMMLYYCIKDQVNPLNPAEMVIDEKK